MRRLLLAAMMAGVVTGPALAQCDTRFTLVNRSGVTVNELYFGPSSNSNWGIDRLGQDVLPNGRQIMFDTGRPGPHDFRVVWSSGERAELMRINICTTSQILATPTGIEAR